MMMRLRRGLAAIVGLLAVAFAASADTLVMKNGDRLTGIVEVSDGKNVTFKTDYAGEIQVAWASIAEVKSDKPIYVVMPDKSTVSGLMTTEGTNIIIHPASGAPVQMSVSQVTVVRGQDQETAYEKSLHPSLLEAWKGGANLGFALSRGNSETTNLTTGFTADRKTINDEIPPYSAPAVRPAAAASPIPRSREPNPVATSPKKFSPSSAAISLTTLCSSSTSALFTAAVWATT